MSFDRLAPHYDRMEAVCGGSLQAARTAWLDELAGCRRILSAGEGHGRFAAACVARHPATDLTCIEASPRMLARARARLGDRADTVHWHNLDLLTWRPDGPYDAIVTCFFLDCFRPTELAQVIDRLADAAAPGARWVVVDFAVPPRGPARWRAQAIHALMYAFFRVATSLPARRLTQPNALLAARGFRCTGRKPFSWGLITAELWQRD